MKEKLAWTLIAAFALGACGAGDRSKEEEPIVNPRASTPAPAPAEPVVSPEAMAEEVVEAEEAEPAEGDMVHPSERLYTVQIAAYLSPDSARSLAGRLEARGLPVWTMEVRVGDETYHRIRVGAHPRLGEARKLGQELSRQFRQDVDRKSTRLNSSHVAISYAVFCL